MPYGTLDNCRLKLWVKDCVVTELNQEGVGDIDLAYIDRMKPGI